MGAHRSAAVVATTVKDLPCWRLVSRHGEALVARQGAQVLYYAPNGQPPVVWLSDQAEFRKGASLRGGIPVCWPWFGQFDRNPEAVRAMLAPGADAPAHGFARALDWQEGGARVDGETACLRLQLDLPAGHGGWNHAAAVTLDIRLDDALTLTLSTRNAGAETLVLSQALHTYFAVSDARDVEVEGLDGLAYVDTLRDWTSQVQDGPLSIQGETDRIYTGLSAPMQIRDPGWRRTIAIEATGSRSAVVWNPWVDKSLRLSQFRPDAWRDMLCIETARVWDDVLELAPGAAVDMSVTMRAAGWDA
ncbi:MAG: D-hexose-6-phosphate mutarotase [Bordetella sp. SCN 67-23]|nr:D-hexose-6-phosphate mutarotase [Burkholderiales bacterium]ODS76188.1 MAG: D-hexose-6-phosphate mutarotase [Bordetella sp. SCN 67-23]OJW93661.1 MAG: D-hexose-6-phosphate mutarotase [Burkholderiales bacterium 67-32]